MFLLQQTKADNVLILCVSLRAQPQKGQPMEDLYSKRIRKGDVECRLEGALVSQSYNPATWGGQNYKTVITITHSQSQKEACPKPKATDWYYRSLRYGERQGGVTGQLIDLHLLLPSPTTARTQGYVQMATLRSLQLEYFVCFVLLTWVLFC